MTSVCIFATLGPAVLTFLVMWFVGRHVPRGKAFGGLSFGWRTRGGRAVGSGRCGDLERALVAVQRSRARPGRHLRGGDSRSSHWWQLQSCCGSGTVAWKPVAPNVFLAVFGPIYLGVLAALWISAPASARPATRPGRMPPICLALAGLWLVMALTASREVKEAARSTSEERRAARHRCGEVQRVRSAWTAQCG